jgi:phosphohistidine phosphatase SixA
MMKIILIRHGAREHEDTSEDKDMPLSTEGKDEARRLGTALARLDLKPEVYLTSHYRHAIETGNILTAQLSDTLSARALSLCALTPNSPTSTFEEVIDEAKNAGINLNALKVVAVVGHEARLSQLLTRLTSSRSRPFGRTEAACLRADPLLDFLC